MTIEHLLLKTRRGAPMEKREQVELDPKKGMVGGVAAAPLRQILLLSRTDFRSFRLNPGDFRENVVVDFDELNELPSGSELQLGTARIRLTFHCEPCSQVASFARPSELLHRRGYLGSITARGYVAVGDSIRVLERRFPEIPYRVQDRLAWFLNQCPGQIDATSLLWEVGLSRSYARALPGLLNKLPQAAREKVRFKRVEASDRQQQLAFA